MPGMSRRSKVFAILFGIGGVAALLQIPFMSKTGDATGFGLSLFLLLLFAGLFLLTPDTK
jgi:hypothetical protein